MECAMMTKGNVYTGENSFKIGLVQQLRRVNDTPVIPSPSEYVTEYTPLWLETANQLFHWILQVRNGGEGKVPNKFG